ncbi:hypothetical protein L7F22_028168 [Adiantum nelumboides]|nr:hypothetical protein [Adiantum nelumboides]
MRQRRWIELLQEYDFDIKYRPGKDNVVADGLSRKSFLNAISIPNNPILDKIKEASVNDPEYQDLIARIQNSGETKGTSKPAKEYSLQGDFLYYEQKLCVPKDPALKKAILLEAHDSPISGHLGSIGMSPFKALYGQECIAPLNFSDPTIKVEASKQMLDEMEAQTKAIRKDIQAAQDKQKQYADKDRSERIFKLGDKVFLRVKPKQSNLSLGKFKKLSPKYCVPYETVKVINDQAYKLRLSPNLKVHDVFHVSLLKPYVPNPDQILDAEQIVVPAQAILELQPNYILETRERKLRNRSIIEHLVKWKDFPEEDATWEDEITLQKDYPNLPLR